MLNLSNEQRDPSTFVKDNMELHERLSLYIGSVISVELDRNRELRVTGPVSDIRGTLYGSNGQLVSSRTVTAGKLERVKLTEGKPGQAAFGYCFEGDSAIREDIRLESSRIRVLAHGSWATIHEPEAWWRAEQEQEKARLDITPRSQWTEEDRQRHGQ